MDRVTRHWHGFEAEVMLMDELVDLLRIDSVLLWGGGGFKKGDERGK